MSDALMKREYRVNLVDGAFFVVDGTGERVSTCPTEEAALAEIADCEKNDILHQHAKSLVQAAVETMMREHGLDREDAEWWVSSAAELI